MEADAGRGPAGGAAGGAEAGEAMDIQQVLRYLPHRFPFLLIDRVLSCVPGESLVAVKNVTFNEPFFTGHFPGHPIMPGVLIVEAIAQATGILAFRTAGTTPKEGTIYYLAAVDNARFKQPVLPGDQLRLEVRLDRALRGVWMFAGQALVEGKVVASCELKCARRELSA